MVATRSRRRVPGRRTFQQFIVHVLLMAASILCLLPMLLIISASFSAENDIALYGYSLIPRNFTTFAYSYILKVPSQLVRSYSRDALCHHGWHHGWAAHDGALRLCVVAP